MKVYLRREDGKAEKLNAVFYNPDQRQVFIQFGEDGILRVPVGYVSMHPKRFNDDGTSTQDLHTTLEEELPEPDYEELEREVEIPDAELRALLLPRMEVVLSYGEEEIRLPATDLELVDNMLLKVCQKYDVDPSDVEWRVQMKKDT